ncbi:MAG: alpha/beta hydrolase [Acutalibacteraceae bacterium]|nr:alpha/beta hydrolase [Acutalibacteraceae bacterium]
MDKYLKCKGVRVNVDGHSIHVYSTGDTDKPRIVLMSGSGTVAPVYDFKILYEKLSEHFRVIVIEKFGYGYSDVFDSPADIDTLVSTQKKALEAIDENGPYILMPHSMSGVEALRWAQMYPDDVIAIIGNDMCTPLTYSVWTAEQVEKKIKLMRFATKYKLQGLLCPLSNRCLTKYEIKQHKLLRKRNAFNICCINESEKILSNVKAVEATEYTKCPILLFVSNSKQTQGHWADAQKEFAAMMNAELICYDCGHYIHHFKSNEMSEEIIRFINSKFKN